MNRKRMLEDTQLVKPPRGHLRRGMAVALLGVLGTGVGCGGAVSSGKAADSELNSLTDAEALLASAEADVQRSFGDRAIADATGGGAEPLDAAPSPAPPSMEPPADRQSDDACELACRALGSMRRAADRICSLSADRCDDATARLTRAERRVFDACPGCSA